MEVIKFEDLRVRGAKQK